jgi:hypothetical protein
MRVAEARVTDTAARMERSQEWTPKRRLRRRRPVRMEAAIPKARPRRISEAASRG